MESNCDWHEHGTKSVFFLNLEKRKGAQNKVKKCIVDVKEIAD